MQIGRRQIVEKGSTQQIAIRLMDSGDALALDLSGHTIAIYSPNKNLLQSSTATGLELHPTDGATLLYSRTWGDEYPRKYGYKAEFSLSSGGTLFQRAVRFDVVRRLFLSQLADQDVFDVYPYIENQLPSGLTTMKPWREQAWKHVEETIRRRWGQIADRFGMRFTNEGSTSQPDIYPGNSFYPEDFFDAHRELTAAFFLRSNAFSTSQDSEDWAKYKTALKHGETMLENVLSSCELDFDDDDVMSTSNKGLSVGVQVIR